MRQFKLQPAYVQRGREVIWLYLGYYGTARGAREGERRLVNFGFRSHRRIGILGGFDPNLDGLADRSRGGRADAALVRLGSPPKADQKRP